jgi:HEPN domain-containing protein
LRAAEAATRDPDLVSRHACLFAQQAAEKAFKAVLVYRSVKFRRIHDLDALRNLIPDPNAWSITQGGLDLAPLTVWAVESRYPGEGPDADTADAATAITIAKIVYDSIVADLQGNGFLLRPGTQGTRQPPLPF